MATDEDNFDIDIYGDGGEEYKEEEQQSRTVSNEPGGADDADDTKMSGNQNDFQDDQGDDDQYHPAPDTSLPKPPIPAVTGIKRKDGPDDRPVDPGATNALFIGELSWWTTDDEIRGWANEAGAEDELKELTFNEQKVNGKSKGQVYLLFESSQASTSTKRKIDEYTESNKYRVKLSVSYTNPLQNPFKTLPKDGPQRHPNNNARGTGSGTSFGSNNNQGGFTPGYRGRGRGNFNSGRGGGFNNNNTGGFPQPAPVAFNPMASGGFAGAQMGGMQNFGAGGYGGRGGFQGGRGGNMGMRGGRGGGGMQPQMGMGMSMPMGGGMMPAMGMSMPLGGAMQMPGGFQAGYNPAAGFGYPQNDGGWSGGPNKRPRQE